MGIRTRRYIPYLLKKAGRAEIASFAPFFTDEKSILSELGTASCFFSSLPSPFFSPAFFENHSFILLKSIDMSSSFGSIGREKPHDFKNVLCNLITHRNVYK